MKTHFQKTFIEFDEESKQKIDILANIKDHWSTLLKIVNFLSEQDCRALPTIKYEVFETFFQKEVKDPWIEQYFYAQMNVEKYKDRNQLGLCLMISLYHNYYVGYSESEGNIMNKNFEIWKKNCLKILASLLDWRAIMKILSSEKLQENSNILFDMFMECFILFMEDPFNRYRRQKIFRLIEEDTSHIT